MKKIFLSTLKCIYSIGLFLLLLFFFSYLFKPVDNRRENTAGFYYLKNNTMDVIYIGGSSTYVFFEPYEAYKLAGIASYDFATDAMSPALIKGYIEETLKTQNPKLFIIDLRAFGVKYLDKYYSKEYLRAITDSFNYSKNRIEMINYSFAKEGIKESIDLSTYIDIILYHNRWKKINKESIKYLTNKVENKYFGFKIDPKTYTKINPINWNDYQSSISFPKEEMEVLYDIIDYIKEKNIKVLFTLNPIAPTDKEGKAIKGLIEGYNYIKDYLSAMGYDFLNTNYYYNEMDIDFQTDFVDKDHVNILGANKYTKFIVDYLKDNYFLPDRRDDVLYDKIYKDINEWNNDVKNQENIVFSAIEKKEEIKW